MCCIIDIKPKSKAMNTAILVHINNPDYLTVIGYTIAGLVEEHSANPSWHCIVVDDETLCILKLTYRLSKFISIKYKDLPTYILSK